MTMEWLLTGFIMLAQFTDPPTSAWFKELHSQHIKNCCDQLDCRRVMSEWRGTPATINEFGELIPGEGSWWAMSNTTGTWVQIKPEHLTREPDGVTIRHSIFQEAILCEGQDPNITDGGDLVPRVYCFAPPPVGF